MTEQEALTILEAIDACRATARRAADARLDDNWTATYERDVAAHQTAIDLVLAQVKW